MMGGVKGRRLHGPQPYQALKEELISDCARCEGLCCRLLCCSKCDGFPADKAAGVPCVYLKPDFQCEVHGQLAQRGLRGCIAYDCFGAGQAAVRTGGDFQPLFRLHRILWYLVEAASLIGAEAYRGQLDSLVRERVQVTDLEDYQSRANAVLGRVIGDICTVGQPKRPDLIGKTFRGGDLAGRDLTLTLLIATRCSGCDFTGTSLLGADLRGADLRGADLRESLFLTQGQVNSARGDGTTALPSGLSQPVSWGHKTN